MKISQRGLLDLGLKPGVLEKFLTGRGVIKKTMGPPFRQKALFPMGAYRPTHPLALFQEDNVQPGGHFPEKMGGT